MLKSKMRKAAKQPRIEKIKSIRNRKRKAKLGGQNTKLVKKNERKRMRGNRKKLFGIRNRKTKAKRQSIVLTGESCDFIDFGSVRNVGAGCTDGTKMVVKNK